MKVRRTFGVLALGLLSTGCVSQEKYNALRLERDGLNEQMARAQQDSTTARAQAASWKSQLDQLMANGGSRDGLTQNLMTQNTDLQKQLADVTAKYNDALGRIGQGAPLPVELSNELTTFADQNPGLVEFDAKTGTVKFKSDLTFSSGDAALQPNALTAINKFATILNSQAAKGYELLVAGHADTQKVSAGTMARGHKDNWYLSSHRALSVAEALQKDGVSSKRIGAVGYGEYRPIASNDTKAGMAMNRRVEVLILPQQIADSVPNAATPVNANTVSEKPKIEVNNDAPLNK
jgi:chemotaxis protein MotB